MAGSKNQIWLPYRERNFASREDSPGVVPSGKFNESKITYVRRFYTNPIKDTRGKFGIF